jgi:hypothetical protein
MVVWSLLMMETRPVLIKNTWRKDNPLPKTNYKYEKRQKEIQKKKKQEEKLKRRQEKKSHQTQESPAQPSEQSVEK